jgi:O-succinylbenzoic acid--CoA ligase
MHWQDEQPVELRREAHFGRVTRCFADRPASVHAMFAAAAAAHPGTEALTGEEGALGYRALETRTARIAGGLAQAGIAPGQRVAMLIGNRFAFVETLLACQRIGAVTVPLNPRQPAPEIAYALNQCAAAGLVFDAELARNLPDPAETPTVRRRWSAYGDAGAERYEALADSPPAEPVPVDEEAPAILVYTSGTTGRPKGAMLTHLNIVHSALHFAHSMGFAPGDRSLLAVPASHVTGLIANIATALLRGGTIVVLRAFRAADCLALMQDQRVTHTLIVPAMYNLFLRDPEFDGYDLSAWKVGGYGGAPMPEATIAEMARRAAHVGLMNGYGATEATSPQTMGPPRFAAARADSVGLVLHCAEIAVMDDDGREVAPGQPGEIWMAGPNIVPGYWDNPGADAENFTGGFWRSGDIGSVDADGFVRVLDRKKDMLNRGGYKIYCVEVESQLSFHPHVLESAIIGRPCPVLGERVHAVIVPKDAAPSPRLAEQIRAFCAARLSDYKVPETIIFREAPLPRNPNGKIVKTVLREEYG